MKLSKRFWYMQSMDQYLGITVQEYIKKERGIVFVFKKCTNWYALPTLLTAWYSWLLFYSWCVFSLKYLFLISTLKILSNLQDPFMCEENWNFILQSPCNHPSNPTFITQPNIKSTLKISTLPIVSFSSPFPHL